jgi:hypothetical protein
MNVAHALSVLGLCIDGHKIESYSSHNFFIPCNCEYATDCYCCYYCYFLIEKNLYPSTDSVLSLLDITSKFHTVAIFVIVDL